MENENRGQVLPFARSAAYLRRLAEKQRAQGNPLQALEWLRLSWQQEPEAVETALEIAELYAVMRCPGLSNRVLFSLLENDENDAACFYGIGCNYAAMGMHACAMDCLTLYLHECPEGEWAQEAAELIESLADAWDAPKPSVEASLLLRIERALTSLDAGKPRLAARQLRRALVLDRRNSGAHALMAFALLGAGRPREALEAARRAFRCGREDVRALCAMAMALHAVNATDAARAFLQRAQQHMEDEESAALVCRVARHIGEHETVIRLLEPVEREAPWSDEVLHQMAVAQYNAGHADEATRRWRMLRRIDPMDTVAEYRLRMAEEGKLEAPVSYERQVPLGETLARLSHLRACVQEGEEALKTRWAEDATLEPLLRWGLTSAESGVPRTMMGVLAAVGGRRARQALVELLCDPFCAQEQKNAAVAALHLMGEQGPFYAEINGRLATVYVSRDGEAGDMAKCRALARAVRARIGGELDEAALEAICRAAASLSGVDALLRARAAECAMRALTGTPCPRRTPKGEDRKIRRYARRILKEAGYHALYQL